jgi:hypothetical protein
MHFAVTYVARATTTLEPDNGFATEAEAFEAHLDRLMEALLAIEATDSAVSNSDISATVRTGDVEISVIVAAGELSEAAVHGFDVIRRAMASAGGELLEFRESIQRPVELVG